MVMLKLVGWGCLILGVLAIIAGPYTWHTTPPAMQKAGVVVGIFLVGLGLLLIKL